MGNRQVDRIIDEQIRYYRARASEYDEWWERRGRYDAGESFLAAWRSDISTLENWVHLQSPMGKTLEVAAGTGNWTRVIEPYTTELTALDSSPEALAICAGKLGSSRTRLVSADIFSWRPETVYETIFSSFWISHIPLDGWRPFWGLMDEALAPRGSVLLIENAPPHYAIANGPPEYRSLTSQSDDDPVPHQTVRRLKDGSDYRVEKHYWTPDQLVSDLEELGWSADVAMSTFAFIYARVRRKTHS